MDTNAILITDSPNYRFVVDGELLCKALLSVALLKKRGELIRPSSWSLLKRALDLWLLGSTFTGVVR